MVQKRNRRKKSNLNTWLLTLGMLLIVIDGFIMTFDLNPAVIKAMLVGSIVVCALLIVAMVWNIIKEGRNIRKGEEQE